MIKVVSLVTHPQDGLVLRAMWQPALGTAQARVNTQGMSLVVAEDRRSVAVLAKWWREQGFKLDLEVFS